MALTAEKLAARASLKPLSTLRPAPQRRCVYEVTEASRVRRADVRFAERWRTAQTLEASGTVLGWNDGAPSVKHYANCMLVMPSRRQVRGGVTVVRLSRESAWPA